MSLLISSIALSSLAWLMWTLYCMRICQCVEEFSKCSLLMSFRVLSFSYCWCLDQVLILHWGVSLNTNHLLPRFRIRLGPCTGGWLFSNPKVSSEPLYYFLKSHEIKNPCLGDQGFHFNQIGHFPLSWSDQNELKGATIMREGRFFK